MSHETDQKTLAEQFYATMLRARRFEEEAFEFYKKGMMPGMAHLYLGEEAVAVGVCTALKPEDCIAVHIADMATLSPEVRTWGA